jgi:hypothetical protein
MGNHSSCQGAERKDFVERWLGFPPATGFNPGESEKVIVKDQQEALKELHRRLEEIERSACGFSIKRDQRVKMESRVLGQLENGDLRALNGVVSQHQLLEIFRYDPEFCGENGKLRQLYVKQWEIQMEINKWRRVALQDKK